MNKPHNIQEFHEQLATSIMQRLIERGIASEDSERIGWEIADEIRKEWGGDVLYIPKGSWWETYKLHDEMYDRYNRGAEVKDIAREYGRALQATYAILRRVKARRKAKQPTLFDGLFNDRELPEAGAE